MCVCMFVIKHDTAIETVSACVCVYVYMHACMYVCMSDAVIKLGQFNPGQKVQFLHHLVVKHDTAIETVSACVCVCMHCSMYVI